MLLLVDLIETNHYRERASCGAYDEIDYAPDKALYHAHLTLEAALS